MILLPKKNLFFQTSDIENRNDLIYKLLAYGSCDFRNNKKLLDKANLFLKQNFSKDDMKLIYKYLGNGLNKELAYSFIRSGYDMNLLDRTQYQLKKVSEESADMTARIAEFTGNGG